jgi:hypothetical protein
MASRAAQDAVAALGAARRSADEAAREGRFDGALQARAEFQLGVDESLGGLVDLCARFSTPRLRHDPAGVRRDASAMASALGDAVTDPLGTARALVDWDTWGDNPARAAGHLAPDVVAGVATGGTAAAAGRSASVAARLHARALARQAERAGQATGAQHLLVERALRSGGGSTLPGWAGPGGARLNGAASAAVAAYRNAVMQVEARISARMAHIAGRVGADLVGLPTRVKGLDSLRRKVALAQVRDGADLATVLARQPDTLRYTLVLPESGYTADASRAATALDRAGYVCTAVNNYWAGGRYRGVNSTWRDPASGVAFEVQFHTPATWRATRLTHPLYEDWRLPTTPAPRRVELATQIAQEYRVAPLPPGATGLSTSTLPPAPKPPAQPLAVSAGAAGGVGLAVLLEALESGPRRRRRERRP